MTTMQNTNTLTDRICSAAMMALAVLPMASLATAAHATTVKVSDLNLASPAGVAAYNQRADHAARTYCSNERAISAVAACRKGVAVELSEKLDAIRTAQAARAQTFAAR
jgi:UrcA family protein